MKRLKRLCAAFFLCVMLLAVPAFGEQETALPSVIEGVARNLDFFAQPWISQRHENHFLHDVRRLNSELIGVSLISPFGFEVQLVYNVNTLEIAFSEIFLHVKSRREAMMRESIRVTDAIRLAESVARASIFPRHLI